MNDAAVARLIIGAVFAASACSAEGEIGGPDLPAATTPPGTGPSTSAPDGGVGTPEGAAPAGSAPAVEASIDAAPPAPARVPMFIAQGHLGRTTVSCDDGHTWIADHDEDPDDSHCNDGSWPRIVECNHNPWAAIGMAEANGYFVATYGWGHPGMVRRTEDGIHWDDVYPGHTLAGMAYGNGQLVGLDQPPVISGSAGALGTWMPGGRIPTNVPNVRTIGFTPNAGGRFIADMETGTEPDVQVSADNGMTWHQAPGRPPECGTNLRGIVDVGGATLMVQANGSVCRSTDGGENWTHVPVTEAFYSNPVVADGTVTVWNQWTRFQSTDGLTWTSAQGTADGRIGPMARAPNGTWVAVQLGSQYDQQQFFRSTDGLVWASLPKTAFVGSHPINEIRFGSAKPSTECPLR